MFYWAQISGDRSKGLWSSGLRITSLKYIIFINVGLPAQCSTFAVVTSIICNICKLRCYFQIFVVQIILSAVNVDE